MNGKELVNIIVKGIKEKKGQDIVIVDLTHIEGAITNYFVICQGNSTTQIEAIEANEKPVGVNGLGNNQWVGIDFVDVIVHVFLPETREFYNLERLWEDAKITKIPNAD